MYLNFYLAFNIKTDWGLDLSTFELANEQENIIKMLVCLYTQ